MAEWSNWGNRRTQYLSDFLKDPDSLMGEFLDYDEALGDRYEGATLPISAFIEIQKTIALVKIAEAIYDLPELLAHEMAIMLSDRFGADGHMEQIAEAVTEMGAGVSEIAINGLKITGESSHASA